MLPSLWNDWKWNYNAGELGIVIRTNDGKLRFLNIHHRQEDLLNAPHNGEAFSCSDARFLGIYEQGLESTGLKELDCLALGLKAVACEQFVRPCLPLTRYFMSFRSEYDLQVGELATIYTVNGKAADCLILERRDPDGLTRLMLLNNFIELPNGRVIKLGKMIRVKNNTVRMFKEFSRKSYHCGARYA